MAATVTYNSTLPARAPAPLITLAAIPVIIDANGATYAAASGGLPFDLFTILGSSSPFSATINPKDIVGFVGTSAAGWVAAQFAVGTTTSTTCPCTMKLWNGTTQFSDGACTQIVTGLLFVQRGGAN